MKTVFDKMVDVIKKDISYNHLSMKEYVDRLCRMHHFKASTLYSLCRALKSFGVITFVGDRKKARDVVSYIKINSPCTYKDVEENLGLCRVSVDYYVRKYSLRNYMIVNENMRRNKNGKNK